VETGQVTIEDATGILDVGMADEEYASRAEEVQLIESNPVIVSDPRPSPAKGEESTFIQQLGPLIP
jgi:hypothetical protein